MYSGTIFSAVLAMIPVFEEISGVPIVVVESGENGYQTKLETRDAVCQKVGVRDCDFSLGAFEYSLMSDGQSYTFNMAPESNPSGENSSVCVIHPPFSGAGDAAGYSYLWANIGPFNFEATQNGFRDDEDDEDKLRAINLLTQMGACVRTPNVDLQTQKHRDLAFALATLQLYVGDESFMAYGGETMVRFVADGLGSEGGSYGAGVAERIQMEKWKRTLAEERKKDRFCNVTLHTSNQPNLTPVTVAVPVPKGMMNCAPEKVDGEGNPYWNAQPIDVPVTDQSLTAILPNMGELSTAELHALIRQDENDTCNWTTPDQCGDPNKKRVSGLAELVFQWSPFENFNGDSYQALSYTWSTANQIMGIDHLVQRGHGQIMIDQGVAPRSSLR